MYVIRARNVEHALLQGMSYLRDNGTIINRRGMDVVESPVPVATVYEQPRERVLFNAERNANPFFHFFESLWIIAGRNDVEFLAHLLPRMAEYSDDGKTFHGAYGRRLRNWWGCSDISAGEQWVDSKNMVIDQIKGAITLLRDKPDTRQCVLSIWDPELDMGTETKDMPCNDMIALSRSGAFWQKLNITVFNRSNDAIWGCYGANAVQFSMLQDYIAGHLGCELGTYTQVSNNYHAYTDNPFWQKYASQSNELFGYDSFYASAPLGKTHTYNLFAEADLFDDDLKGFFQQWRGGPMSAKSEAFIRVVLPMWASFHAYKAGDLDGAIALAHTIAATDWRVGCTYWLNRIKASRAGA